MRFIDLQEQYRLYREEILVEIEKVICSAQFINGPAVKDLEKSMCDHSGVKHAIGCASGTDALLLGLMALNVKPGDEIIVPDFTFFATAEVVALLGATPIFCDIEEKSFNLDVSRIGALISKKTKGIIPVSLFGQCAELEAVNKIANDHGLWVMEDAAQSYGAIHNGRRSCSMTLIATTSFYPAKPLGCYGEGGAVFTNDDAIADKIRKLLNHGQSAPYTHSMIGINGRLDTLQAAILNVKLRHFEEEMKQKRLAADAYSKRLSGFVTIPHISTGNTSVWAQYTIRSPQREKIIEHMKKQGIPFAIHYPIPLHKQDTFLGYKKTDAEYPVATKVSKEVLSLPMHPFLADSEIEKITHTIIEALS